MVETERREAETSLQTDQDADVALVGEVLESEKKRNVYRDPAMHWKATTVLICVYGIVKEFRPATPFLTPFLVSPYKNFTDVQLYSEIYPFWTYSYLVALIPVFFLTDILRYKAIIMLEASCLCGTWALLVWGTTVWQMQLMQIVFGVASAAEIAYYSYMYAVVDQKYYKKITSYIRAAEMVGKFFAFALAQFLVSTGYGSYLLLNQISLVSVCIIFVIAIILPPIPKKIITNRVQVENAGNARSTNRESERQHSNDIEGSDERAMLETKPPSVDNGVAAYFKSIWKHFQIYKTNKVVLKWSLWSALTSCGIYQVYNYVQTLWATMQHGDEDTKNGVTECANTLIGAFISFSVQYMHVNWIKHGEVVLFLTSAIAAAIIFALSQTQSILFAYILYIAVASIYHMLMTAASANIAAQLDSASYGLVFGWNGFMAVLLQTILTLAVADKHGLALNIRDQFVVYACYFGAVALIFTLIMIFKCMKRTSSAQDHPVASVSGATLSTTVQLDESEDNA